MSEIINIAFCIDFSAASKACLESIMFNTWNFRCNIHLIHFTEEQENETESKENLDKLLKETRILASEGQTVSSRLFKKVEFDDMINILNNSNYQIIASGMPFKKAGKKNSFISLLTENVDKDLTFIPQSHKVKIENRATIVVDIANLENVYLCTLFEEYYKFLYTKITILLLSDELLDEKAFAKAEEKIRSILPTLDLYVINHDKSNCLENLKTEIKKDNIDYLILYKNDYFEKFILNVLANNQENIQWNFTIYRGYVNEEIINNIKKGIDPYPRITLN